MASENPFAQVAPTPEPLIARIRQELLAEFSRAGNPPPVELDRVAEEAVRGLWDCRVRTFVSVLAMRDARAMLGTRSGGPPVGGLPVGGLPVGAPGERAGAAPRARPAGDRLPLGGSPSSDALPLSEHDALPLDG